MLDMILLLFRNSRFMYLAMVFSQNEFCLWKARCDRSIV